MGKARLIVKLGSTLTLVSPHLTQDPGLQNESQSCVTDESQHECFSLTSYGGGCSKNEVPLDHSWMQHNRRERRLVTTEGNSPVYRNPIEFIPEPLDPETAAQKESLLEIYKTIPIDFLDAGMELKKTTFTFFANNCNSCGGHNSRRDMRCCGPCPSGSSMSVKYSIGKNKTCPDTTSRMIEIEYQIRDGVKKHAYLCNEYPEARKLLVILVAAFLKGHTFTVDERGAVKWNGIHNFVDYKTLPESSPYSPFNKKKYCALLNEFLLQGFPMPSPELLDKMAEAPSVCESGSPRNTPAPRHGSTSPSRHSPLLGARSNIPHHTSLSAVPYAPSPGSPSRSKGRRSPPGSPGRRSPQGSQDRGSITGLPKRRSSPKRACSRENSSGSPDGAQASALQKRSPQSQLPTLGQCQDQQKKEVEKMLEPIFEKIPVGFLLKDTPINITYKYEGPTKRLTKTDLKSVSAPGGSEVCKICLCDHDPECLQFSCNHIYCKGCIEGMEKIGDIYCPSCKNESGGIVTKDGPCPVGTTMSIRYNKGDPYITIHYNVPGGIQTSDHQNPGRQFRGITRTAYLWNQVPESREMLVLLIAAFLKGHTFTVGTSTTDGRENVVTWNDIHHFTNCLPATQKDNPQYVYTCLNPTKYKGVLYELNSMGIELPSNFRDAMK